MGKCLNKQRSSRSSLNFSLSRYGLDDETEDKEVTLVRHLDTEEGWRVGGLAWNSLDTRLVISTVEEHSDWCDHTAKILVYNIDR